MCNAGTKLRMKNQKCQKAADKKMRPKKVYDYSKDIVFRAFNSEVLSEVNPISTDSNINNLFMNLNTEFKDDAPSHLKNLNPLTAPEMFETPPQSIAQQYLTHSNTSEASDFLLDLGLTKQDVFNLITSIPALNEKYSVLESKYSALETKCTSLSSSYSDLSSKHTSLESNFSDLKKENETLKRNQLSSSSSSEKSHNNLSQYTRRNSLKAHRLKKVPTWLRGTDFSKWVANELSKLIPGLEISYLDIDTSHFLYYEFERGKRYPVIIIKFIRRDLRNDILKRCGQDGYLENSDVYFTDHLTVSNRKLFESAQAKYTQVWTDQCKIFVNDNGRKREITEESDLTSSSNFVVIDDSSNIINYPAASTSSSNNVPINSISLNDWLDVYARE